MSYHIKSGKHLGVVRSWMQRKFKNGESVDWGSNDQLQPLGSLTPDVMEHLAQDIADAAVSEVLADVSNLSRILERAEQTLKKLFPRDSRDTNVIDAYGSLSWDLTLAKSELAKMLENKSSTVFQVFDCMKPAQYPDHAVSKSWSNSKFSTFDEAVSYARNWLGACYDDPDFEWEIDKPCQYGEGASYVVIKKIED